MITERLSFRAKYGHGDELVAIFKEQQERMGGRFGEIGVRIYTDATGPMFSVIAEFDYPDLPTWAKYYSDPAMYSEPGFAEWFARMQAVTESGERQLFNMERLA